MHLTAKFNYGVLTISLLAAVGCSRLTTLGISGEGQDGLDTPKLETSGDAESFVARQPTTIMSASGEIFDWTSPFVGDVDGDGLDDFILPTRATPGLGASYRNYLFYGRKDFPEVIDTAEADATFGGGPVRAHALGDIDGDGLADFAVTYETGFDIVLGSRTRWSGTHPQYSLGAAWYFGREQPDGSTLSVNSLQRIGDVDGDGFGEFLVRVVTTTLDDQSRTGWEPASDYLIAGRADGWPSGDWDPSWAVAQFEGALAPNWKTPQDLEFVGSGDVDGDGYVDILATAGNRPVTWVFYGSAAGLTGALSGDRAGAEIKWAPSADERYAYNPTCVVLGDLDGDGTAELGAVRGSELAIRYGSEARLSGVVSLAPDLTLHTSATQIIHSRAADIDGDSLAELIVHTQFGPNLEPDMTVTPATTAVYAVRATSMHATGDYELSDADLYRPAGADTLNVLENSFMLDIGGDVDGDGSYDMISLIGSSSVDAEPVSSVYLVPGMPRAPD